MVKLTDINSGVVCFINPKHVTSVSPIEEGSYLVFNNGRTFDVEEDPQQVVAIIEAYC